jgi:hypothetical protein
MAMDQEHDLPGDRTRQNNHPMKTCPEAEPPVDSVSRHVSVWSITIFKTHYF